MKGTCKDIAEKVGSLPPLPDTAIKLMNVVNDPHSSVEDLVEAIRYDQAITGEVLRVCNSAYFGLARRVSSLNDAMLCLGTLKVMQLVMAIHANSLMASEQRGYGLAAGDLWKHSVGVAIASGALAQKMKLPQAGQAFTAGLLHDIGKVVLNEYVAEQFAEILERVNTQKQSFIEAEQDVLGFNHQDIGGEIAERWQLPEPITRCIRHHHDPSAADPPDPLVDGVHLADCICMMLGIGLGADGLAYRADSEVMERYELREQDLEDIGVQALTELKRVQGIFAEPAGAGESTKVAGR